MNTADLSFTSATSEVLDVLGVDEDACIAEKLDGIRSNLFAMLSGYIPYILLYHNINSMLY